MLTVPHVKCPSVWVCEEGYWALFKTLLVFVNDFCLLRCTVGRSEGSAWWRKVASHWSRLYNLVNGYADCMGFCHLNLSLHVYSFLLSEHYAHRSVFSSLVGLPLLLKIFLDHFLASKFSFICIKICCLHDFIPSNSTPSFP